MLLTSLVSTAFLPGSRDVGTRIELAFPMRWWQPMSGSRWHSSGDAAEASDCVVALCFSVEDSFYLGREFHEISATGVLGLPESDGPVLGSP